MYILKRKRESHKLQRGKWQSKVNAEEIFRELAKSFKRKINEYEGRKVYCIDLEETKKMLIL